MIRLTERRTNNTTLVAPAAIYTTGYAVVDVPYPTPTGVADRPICTPYVVFEGSGGDMVEIVEEPHDVARLLAAWEMRYHAPEIRGDLPISVGMVNGQIIFFCCEITKRLKDQIAAEKAAIRRQGIWPKLRLAFWAS